MMVMETTPSSFYLFSYFSWRAWSFVLKYVASYVNLLDQANCFLRTCQHHCHRLALCQLCRFTLHFIFSTFWSYPFFPFITFGITPCRGGVLSFRFISSSCLASNCFSSSSSSSSSNCAILARRALFFSSWKDLPSSVPYRLYLCGNW